MANSTYNSLDELNKSYDSLYKSRMGQLTSARDQELLNLSGQGGKIRSNYDITLRDIEKSRLDTQNKYLDLYTGLVNKQRDGVADYYNQRNGAMFQNAKNVQALREHMARNNLLASGESVDGMLRNNSDFSNNMGGIKSNESLFLRELNDTRNRYKGEEQSAYTSFENSRLKASEEKARLIAELAAQKSGIYSKFNKDKLSAFDDIEAQKAKAIFDYQQAEKDRALQRELASRSYGGGGGSSSYGLTYEEMLKGAVGDYKARYDEAIANGDNDTAQYLLSIGLGSWGDGGFGNYYTSDDWYQQNLDLQALENKQFEDQQANAKASGATAQYGYRNGVAGWYYPTY